MVAGPAGVAFAPGAKGSLAKTTDGGANWVRGNVSTPNDVIDVSFPTATDGFALDSVGGLFRTADGGATWRALDTGTTARPTAVEAPSKSVVLIAGPRGVRRSTDAGDTFSSVSGSVAKSPLSDIDSAGSALFAFGSQLVWRSTNKGKTWTSVRKPGKYVTRGGKKVNTKGVGHVDFVSSKAGYFLDTNGFVYRTTNGGKSWTTLLATGNGTGVRDGVQLLEPRLPDDLALRRGPWRVPDADDRLRQDVDAGVRRRRRRSTRKASRPVPAARTTCSAARRACSTARRAG